MFIVTVAILAIFILVTLDHNFTVGIVLAGLLALLTHYVFRVRDLGKQIIRLEQKLRQHATESETDTATSSAPVYETPTTPVKADVTRQDRSTEQKSQFYYARQANSGDQAHRPVDQQPTEQHTTQATTTTSAPQVQAQNRSAAAAPPPPREPNIAEKLIKKAWDWFTDGNVFVRVGIIILFMGMTFLIRYAIHENLVPIELRLAAVSAVAIAVLYWGWRQRITKPTFSLVAQGGGIGLLYLTIFAGFSLYHVIPSTLAFVLLAITVILAAVLAIVQDAKQLALFATIGGFLAPILTSSGSNNYIGLFSYYTVLNLGIFSVAWFKSWRILNFVGFVFTFGISTIWGALSYEPQFFATTEPFLIIFFLLYVGIGILFAHRRAPEFNDYIDSSVIFGTPLLAFGLQCALVNDYEYGIAISASAMAAFYLAATNILWNRYGGQLRLLSETFLSLGVIFATLAVPFAIDGSLTGATWAIEGAGILWISIKQQQKYRRLFAIALMFAAGVILASEIVLPLGASPPVFDYAFANSVFIGCVIIMLSSSAGSWLLSRDFAGKLDIERTLGHALLVYSLITLLAGFEYQIADFALYPQHGSLLAIVCTACVLGYTIHGKKHQWLQAQWAGLVFIVPLAIAAVLCYAYQPQLSAYMGYIIWPLAILAYFYALKISRHTVAPGLIMGAHVLAAIIIACLLLWEGLWQLLLCYALLAITFNVYGNKFSWPQLKVLALGFLPVLVVTSIGAVAIDGNLIDLSSIAAGVSWPFPPGYVLWPFGFAVYFYLLHQNQRIANYSTQNLHYAGAGLIAALLLWLGLWPLLLGASLLCALACYLWIKFSWAEMRITCLALLPIMLLTLFIKLLSGHFDPFELPAFNVDMRFGFELGYLLWPLSFIVTFWSYKQSDNQQQSAHALLHSIAVVFLAWLITVEASWHILDVTNIMNAWHLSWLPITSMLTIYMIMQPSYWPFTQHNETFKKYALLPLTLVLSSWAVIQLFSSGSSNPLPWIPVINPVDIVLVIMMMGGVYWNKTLFAYYHTPPSKRSVYIALLAFGFIWANVDLLRVMHHWAGIAWQMPTILTSNTSQTALSLFWALSGLATTIYASRKHRRTLWIIGAALLAVVVLKLFLIDSSARDTVERIVSFTGVGILLMLVGYFSPLPPQKAYITGETDAQ